MIKMDLTLPDFQRYEELIGASGNINFLDAKKFEQTMMRCISCSTSLSARVNMLFYYMLRYDCGGTVPEDDLKTFVDSCEIPHRLYSSYKNKKGYTFDKDARREIIEWISQQDSITMDQYLLMNFMDTLQEKKTLDYVVSSCRKSQRNGLIKSSNIMGWNDTSLLEIHNIYLQAITGRYYAREMPIVGLPAPIRYCFTPPCNYVYISMDLRQIDLSVAYDMYLRGTYPEYDAIFDEEPEDKYKAMFKIICMYNSMEIDMDFFEKHRDGVKKNILAGLYQGQLNTLNATFMNTQFNSTIVQFYENHEGYQAQVRKIQELYDLRIPFTIRDAFGFEMHIEVAEVAKFGLGDAEIMKDFNKVARDCISYVTQATSNSIKVKWTNKVMDEIDNLDRDDMDIWISIDRHDEIVFSILVSKLEEFMPIIKQHELIQIANWGTIRFKTEVFLHYGDPEMTWNNEADVLKDINEKIAKVSEKTIVDIIPKEESYTFRGIPSVHDIYLMSTSLPSELFQEQLGRDPLTCLAYTEGTSLTLEDVCAKEIASCAKEGRLPSNLQDYDKLWNKFIIRNSNSGNEFPVIGINSIPAILSKFGIEYVRVHTVIGDGFCSLGDAYGMKDSLTASEVISRLTSHEY